MSSIAPLQPPQPRQPRVKDEEYLRFIRRLSCMICLHETVEAAHIRYADAERGKRDPGMGAKPDDKWALPLCAEHHRLGRDAQHMRNERKWWKYWLGRDPLDLCELLYDCYPDEERARGLINEWRAA